MKKAMSIALMLSLLAVLPAAAGTVQWVKKVDNWRVGTVQPVDNLDEEISIFLDDFEGTQDPWTTNDLTGAGTMWHTDAFNAYNDGTSWWCGDPAVGGYNNHWLQYLESPSLDLSAAGTDLALTFQMYLDCEAPGGEPAGYDGWDGANVWYSTDGGTTWTVLPNPTPAYLSTSLYSFGDEFGMGQGIAGWNGSFPHVWTAVNFDLSAFAGESDFMFRIAFCSDPAEATPESGYLGMFVDDVMVADGTTTYLENDAEGTAVPSDLVPIQQVGSGDLWELQTEEYHSADNAWHMGMGYDLLDAVISGPIDLPEGYSIYMNYWLYCNMPDSDGDGDNYLEDYFRIEVSTDGVNWTMLCYDWGDRATDGGSALDDWAHRTTGFLSTGGGDIAIDLSDYAGQTVQIRFTGITDDNDDGGTGLGIYIDDVELRGETFEHDVLVQPLFIPFPNTVNRVIPATATFVNNGGSDETGAGAIWFIGTTVIPFNPFQLDLVSGEELTLFLDNNLEDGQDGWVPTDPGDFNVYARITLANDENQDNNITPTVPVTIRPVGEYEFGFDDRIAEYTTSRFGVGEGPITHFELPDDFTSFDLDTLRVVWNGDLVDPTDFNVHVFAGGDEPGAEIWSGTFTADPAATYPYFQGIYVGDVGDLQGLTTDFWVWYEVTSADGFPHIIFSSRDMETDLSYPMGEGHHFEYDGTSVTDGNADWMIRAFGYGTLDVAERMPGVVPASYSLASAYPNPFNPSTTLRFDVARAGKVSLVAYNVMGREVARIVDRELSPGRYNARWNAKGLASGVYFIRMEADGFSQVRKVMLMK